MKPRFLLSAAALLAASFAPAALAEGRHPGSVLIYTIHRSGPGLFTVVSVTNTNTLPQTPISFGGSTLVHFQYLNTIENPADTQVPLGCYINNRTEFLTPADTLSVLTTCHNAAHAEGYLVIDAEDPSLFLTPWVHNDLIGSEIVVNAAGGVYSINAIPFLGIGAPGSATDLDNDGRLDFDNLEYEAIPKNLYCDSFLAIAGSSLTLINLTGGVDFLATVRFDIWNDNEQPLSATKTFRCWMEERLIDINLVFSEAYLHFNTPNDPIDLDVNCDNRNDFETGWFRIVPLVASSTAKTWLSPAILGSITCGPTQNIDGGRLLWESNNQVAGEFLGVGVNCGEDKKIGPKPVPQQ